MTYVQFYAARQLIAEERLGAPLRRKQRAEQAQVESTKAAIRRTMPKADEAVVVVGNGTPRVIQPRPITDEIVGV